MADKVSSIVCEIADLWMLRDTQAESGKLHLLPAIDELISKAEAKLRAALTLEMTAAGKP